MRQNVWAQVFEREVVLGMRQHDQYARACSSQRITEDSIYKAFIRMYNKLKQNQNNILTPLLAQLEKLTRAGI